MNPWEDRFDEMSRKTEDVRRKMFIDALREKNPAIDPRLAMLTPAEVLEAARSDREMNDFIQRISSDYSPPDGRVALIYPDSERKPWTRGSTDALSYRNLYTALKSLGLNDRIELFALSPVAGLIPEAYFGDMPMYESSGLSSFMVKRRGLTWSQEDFKAVIDLASDRCIRFLEQNHSGFGAWHAIYRAPSVHERIIQEIMNKRPFPIWTYTSKKSLSDTYLEVRKLVDNMKRSL